MTNHRSEPPAPALDWEEIDDVLLDMDGTLLDRHFDNFFFEEELPRRYAALQGLAVDVARDRLMGLYRSVEGELAWTDLHYWTERVGLDVVAMHRELDHMIGFLPDAPEFLSQLRVAARVTILTNAHRAGVEVKAAKTGLDQQVDRIVDAFEVGYLKMRQEYWPACQRLRGSIRAARSLSTMMNGALAAAQRLAWADLFIAPSPVRSFPPELSDRFHSIESSSVLSDGRRPS
ncbi:MAG: haloacid dehalogenase-like hydrolase [Nitrospiraceae bacterium]